MPWTSFAILLQRRRAVTKSGTGTWDLGREDSGTSGRGTRGRGDAGTRGRGDVGTRGRGDVGTWGRGTWDAGTWDSGTRDSKTLGLGDVGPTGLEDVINKQHLIFSLNLLITIFDALEKGINYAGEFVSSLVADDFQRPWFGLICLLAYATVKAPTGT